MQNTQWFELTSSGAKRDLSLSQLRAFKRFRWYSVKRFALEIISTELSAALSTLFYCDFVFGREAIIELALIAKYR